MSSWLSSRYNFSWAKACDAEFKRDAAVAQECVAISTILRSYFNNPKTQIEVCAVKSGSMWDVAFVALDHNRRSSSIVEILALFPKTPSPRAVHDVTMLDGDKVCVSFEIPVTNSVGAPEIYEAEVRRSQSRRPRSRSRSSSPSRRRSSRRSPSPDCRRRSASPNERRRRDDSPRNRDESPRRRGDSPETPGVARKALNFLLGH